MVNELKMAYKEDCSKGTIELRMTQFKTVLFKKHPKNQITALLKSLDVNISNRYNARGRIIAECPDDISLEAFSEVMSIALARDTPACHVDR